MAAVPITFLPSAVSIDPALDPIPVVDISDTTQSPTGTTKKIVANQIIADNHAASFSTLTTTSNATIGGNLTVSTDALYVDGVAKQVGIGTNTPSLSEPVGLHIDNQSGDAELKVESDTSVFSIQAVSNQVKLWSTTNTQLLIGNNNNSKVVIYANGQTAFADYLENPSTPAITNLFDQNTGIYFPDDDEIAISTGGSERLRVDDTGKVNTTDDLLVGGNTRINDLTASQVVFTDGTKYLETKTAVDARTALQTTTYSHTQSVSANPWIINHNLNAFPTVWVIDPLGRAGWTEVEYVNNNTLKVHFPGPQTGTAYLNF